MNRPSHHSILFFCLTSITILSLKSSTLQKQDLPEEYQQEHYLNIYQKRIYNSSSIVMMQLYKEFLKREIVPDTIDLIFSLNCTKRSFIRCNKNCTTHNTILNRGFPEFPEFKIIDFVEYSLESNTRGGFKIELKEKEASTDLINLIKEMFIKRGLTLSKKKHSRQK